jgi:phosphoenolpyruvate carboxykinase (ATP)
VNRFYDIVMQLVDKYPDKVRFFQYNTGGMGEVIQEYEEDGIKKKNVVRKVSRVPINLMAAIQRGDLKKINGYEPGMFGTREIATVEGKTMGDYAPHRFYSQDEIDVYLQDIVDGRREYTEMIAAEGLKHEIMAAAEKSFEIAPKSKATVAVSRPDKAPETDEEATGAEAKAEKDKSPVARFWQPTNRIPGPPRWRNR